MAASTVEASIPPRLSCPGGRPLGGQANPKRGALPYGPGGAAGEGVACQGGLRVLRVASIRHRRRCRGGHLPYLEAAIAAERGFNSAPAELPGRTARSPPASA